VSRLVGRLLRSASCRAGLKRHGYAAGAVSVDAFTLYSVAMTFSVMSYMELPATLTKWKFCFIFVDIPSENDASSLGHTL